MTGYLHPIDNTVDHPDHYNSHPSGVECIQITEHMSFCLGNAIKYIWRADHKNNAMEDLKKAAWYINREIERREKADKKKKEITMNQIMGKSPNITSIRENT